MGLAQAIRTIMEVKLSRAEYFVVMQVGFGDRQDRFCRSPEVVVGSRRRWFGDCHKMSLRSPKQLVAMFGSAFGDH